MAHWIPVEERLPEPAIKIEASGNRFMISDQVLTIRKKDDGYRMDVLQWEEDDKERKYWVGEDGEIIGGVIAWMPLQEALEEWRG